MRAAGRALAAVLSAALILASAPQSAWAGVGRLVFARPSGSRGIPAAAARVLPAALPRAAVPAAQSISAPIAQMSAEALHLEAAPDEEEKAALEAKATPDAESSVAGASRHFDLSAQSGRAADPPPATAGAAWLSLSPGVSLSLRGLTAAGRGRGVIPAASKGASLDRLSWSLRLFWRDPAVRLSVLWVLGLSLTAFLTLPTVHLLSLPPAAVLRVLTLAVLGFLLVGRLNDGRMGIWAARSLPFLVAAIFALVYPWWVSAVLLGGLALSFVQQYAFKLGRPVRSLRRAALRTLGAFRGADVERIALGLASARQERRQALAEIAESPVLSSAFGPALVEESKSSWKLMEPEDASLLVGALAGANDFEALERLKILNLAEYRTSWPNLQHILDEAIASLSHTQETLAAGLARAAEALKTAEGDPLLGEQALEAAAALRRRAEAFLQIAGGGWLESKQREAVVLALKDLDAAASPDERAIVEARLRALIDGAAGGIALGGARGGAAVGTHAFLSRLGAMIGIAWPVAAAALVSSILGAVVALAILIHAVPLLAQRGPDPALVFSVVPVAAAQPAIEAAGRLVERMGLARDSVPRIGVFVDPNISLQAMADGVSPERARFLETHNAMALGSGLGREGAIGVGQGFLAGDRDVLEGIVAHELGHLRYGDPARLWRANLWAAEAVRVSRFAMWLAVPAALLMGGGLFGAIVVVGGLGWGLSRVSLAAMSRSMESRADRFAASLVGEESYRGLLDLVRSWGGSEEDSTLFSHPSLSKRQARL